MQNVGSQQFSYDAFKAIYDKDPMIQRVIGDFDQNAIHFQKDELNTLGSDTPDSNTVSQMAQRATKLGK